MRWGEGDYLYAGLFCLSIPTADAVWCTRRLNKYGQVQKGTEWMREPALVDVISSPDGIKPTDWNGDYLLDAGSVVYLSLP